MMGGCGTCREGGATADEPLARRARDGCRGCFSRLYERYRNAVARYVFEAFVRSFDVALDIESEVWRKVVEHLPGYGGERPFRAWLLAIARHHALNELRHVRRAPPPEALLRRREEAPDALEALERRETSSRCAQLVASLPEELREVFVLRVLFDLSPRILAELFGVPPTTIKGRLFRARQWLFERARDLAPEGEGA